MNTETQTMKPDPYRFFVYTPGAFWIENAFARIEDARAGVERAKARDPSKEYLISEDWDAFTQAAEASFMGPATKIDEDRWDDMLGMLPPMQWHFAPDGVELFLICEATYGNVHTQFAKLGDLYAEKNVRRGDRATYITRAEVEAVNNV